MYDELIKSLREATGWKNASVHYSLMNEAADAIEELITNYDAATDIMRHQTEYIEELQATLCNWCAVCSEDKRDLSTCEIYESCRAKPPKEG